MAKWEYCVITGCRGDTQFHAEQSTLGTFAKRGLFTTELGRKEAKDAGLPHETHLVASKIAQLGEDGWEMVGCGACGESSHSIYFRRRIADSD